VHLSNWAGLPTDDVTGSLDIETLAGSLVRGEFPENYDIIIRNISDEDLEWLWAVFKQKWRVMNEGGGDVPSQAHAS
jgi:hypothetical protein